MAAATDREQEEDWTFKAKLMDTLQSRSLTRRSLSQEEVQKSCWTLVFQEVFIVSAEAIAPQIHSDPKQDVDSCNI